MTCPLVSIIILACNKSAYTRRTLDGLLETTYPSVELILVDNGSTDETRNVFSDFAQTAGERGWTVRQILLEENVGAIEGRNRALAEATGDFIVFMDNDIVIGKRSWLECMTGILAADESIGILGPKILFAAMSHDIQCAGCMVGRGGRVGFRGRGEPCDHPDYETPCDVQALISACWIMPRRVVETVGELDARFHPVQFEDIDYCYRVREAGWRVVYDPSVTVYHFENVTTDGTPSLNYKYLTVKNGLKFKRKWAHCFSKENGPEDASMEWRDIPHARFEDVGDLIVED